MRKLQELITKHREKIGYLYNNVELKELHWKYYITMIDNFMLADDMIYKDLSHLLFSTPFLSLLEWKIELGTELRQHKNSSFYDISLNGNNSNFHKINLALLESDRERVNYIESFTL